MGVCTKERQGVAAEVLMATPCTNSLGESVKGGAGVRLPGFPVFCAPGYAPPSGEHSPALPPSSATGEDRRQFINDPGSD